jgi:ketosteroid isomerase-like protein
MKHGMRYASMQIILIRTARWKTHGSTNEIGAGRVHGSVDSSDRRRYGDGCGKVFNCRLALLMGALSMVSACATGGPPRKAAVADAGEAVRSAESAFAKAMADRDFNAFVSHLSADAVFFDSHKVQHGAAEVSAAWKPLFRDPTAPFAWTPDHVEVLASGDLALSTGPVIVNGKVVGRFNSIWRLEAPHTWRIVFDKGESICTDAPR